MTVGKLDRALVGIERGEIVFELEQIGELLGPPPGVRLGHFVVVVRGSQKVHGGGVPRVPVGVEQTAVAAPVQRDVRVPVGVAPVDEVGLPAGLHPIGADPLHLLGLIGMDPLHRTDGGRRPGLQGQRFPTRTRSQGRDHHSPVLGQCRLGAALVGGPDAPDASVRIESRGRRHVVPPAALPDPDQITPPGTVVAGDVDFPHGEVPRPPGRTPLGDVADQQPGVTVRVDLEMGKLPLAGRIQAIAQGMRRGEQLLAVHTGHAQPTRLPQFGPLAPDQPAGVFPPLGTRLVPSHPDSVLGIHGYSRGGLVALGPRHHLDRLPLDRRRTASGRRRSSLPHTRPRPRPPTPIRRQPPTGSSCSLRRKHPH